MSRIFGEVRQLGFVVPDLDEAMQHWAQVLGVGPFFVRRRIVMDDFRYRGHAAQAPRISIALAHSGATQVELIQQHDTVPSIYLDFLASGRTGLQHLSSWYTRAGFDACRRRLLASGVHPVQEGTIAPGGARVAYFDTERGGCTPMFEIADLDEPGYAQKVAGIARAAAQWQGGQHVIEIPA